MPNDKTYQLNISTRAATPRSPRLRSLQKAKTSSVTHSAATSGDWLPRYVFDQVFEVETDYDGNEVLHVKLPLYSDGYISALGQNAEAGAAGGNEPGTGGSENTGGNGDLPFSFTIMEQWPVGNLVPAKAALSAALGVDLNRRLGQLEVASVPRSTDDLTEGSSNLYFTDQRARNACHRHYLSAEGGTVTGSVTISGHLAVGGLIHSELGIMSQGFVTAYGMQTTSDARLKTVLGDVDLSVDEIAQAPAVLFSWPDGRQDVGTIAQYWQAALPEVVAENDRGILSLDYGRTALLAAITLAREVKRLKSIIEDLKNGKHTD